MSDMSKGLQRASGLRWVLLSCASLLTVVAFGLGWIEVVNETSSAPRAFVWGSALVVWIAFVVDCAVVFTCHRLTKRIDRATERIIDAYMAVELVNGNVKKVNFRR